MGHYYLSALVAFATALNLVALVWMWARTHQLDVPNERSSHVVPTPRGGGIAIVLVALGSLPVLWWAGHLTASSALAISVAGAAVAAIGHLDDRRGISAAVRALVHTVASMFAVVTVGGVSFLQIGDSVWNPGVFGAAVAVVGTVWMINLTNFMDGIDGLVASHAIFVSAAGAVLLWSAGDSGMAAFMIILASASAGLLVFNWPPARIFMGDVSSGFLGLVIALAAIATADEVSLWAWGILMTPFVADATVTRAMRYHLYGDLFGAHRTHVYQQLSRKWKGHAPVVRGFWMLSIAVYLPLAIHVASHPDRGWWLMPAAWTATFAVAYVLGAGREDEPKEAVRPS